MSSVADSMDVDLWNLTLHLREVLGDTLIGDVVGRMRLVREVTSAIECGEVEAEVVVDALVVRRLIERRQDPYGVKYWKVGPAQMLS